MSITESEAQIHRADISNQCPVDHSAWSHQKTARVVQLTNTPIERDDNGVWHIHGFNEARTVLRGGSTKQAGFGAEMMGSMQSKMKPAILFMEGKDHHQQRKQTARFFTPKTVSSSYQQLMEKQVDQLIAKIERKKQVDLSELSLTLAVRVASEVVGLTRSYVPGKTQRLDAFFKDAPDTSISSSSKLRKLIKSVLPLWRTFSFFWFDVKPSIKDRRRTPKEDVISHLIAQNYTDMEILTECLTFAAAGMATTREFISVAAWHFLEQPALRSRYLVASAEERSAMLEEILRLEPVVGNLYRRAIEEIHIQSGGQEVVIHEGDLINVDIHGANTDTSVVGADALAICPARELTGDRVPTALMSFGDGHHRCPGSYIAIQESDIFLRRLLALDGLHIIKQPHMTWNDLVTGYELRDFTIAIN
jgi:cytochrome P450